MIAIPHRHLEGLFTTIASATATLLAASAAISETIPHAIVSNDILTNVEMRFACIIGALLGAMLQTAIFPPKVITSKAIAVKMGTSAASGIMLAPLIIRYTNIAPGFDVVLGISGIVALIAIGVIKLVVPGITKQASDRILGKGREPEE